MTVKKENVKRVAIVAAIGFGVGVVVTSKWYQTHAYILKTAKWADNGDMILTFYHRTKTLHLYKP